MQAENIKFTIEQQMVFFARLVGHFQVADDITPIKVDNLDWAMLTVHIAFVGQSYPLIQLKGTDRFHMTTLTTISCYFRLNLDADEVRLYRHCDSA